MGVQRTRASQGGAGDDTSEKKARYPAHEVTWRASKGAQLYNTPVRRAVHTGPWLPGGTSPAKARPPSASSTARSSGVATQAATSRAVSARTWSPTRRTMRAVSPSRGYRRPGQAEVFDDWPTSSTLPSSTISSVRRSSGSSTQRSTTPRRSTARSSPESRRSSGRAVSRTVHCSTPPRADSHTRRGEATESPIEDVVKALRTDGQRGWSKPLWAAGAIASQQLTNQVGFSMLHAHGDYTAHVF